MTQTLNSPSPSDAHASLNEAQKKAVTLPADHHALVLAGAGSGKTRVLIHRILWLIQHHRIHPKGICAVTFTNKAANEMRARLSQGLQHDVPGIWVGTFHGINHRLLRTHYEAANLTKNFQILDGDDQIRLVKQALRDLNIDPKANPPEQCRSYINRCKDDGLRTHHLAPDTPWEQQMLNVYLQYESICKQGSLVDFAEILLRSYELFKNNTELLAHYRQQWSHLLVDEFQDTNAIQYKWIKLLNDKHNTTFIVCDDDQSIYGWRGAKVENIKQFITDFSTPEKPVEQVVLEQNYRSTKHILACANRLISSNEDRLGKKLWTNSDRGELVSVCHTMNGLTEASFVIDRIIQWVDDGGDGDQAAILYRSNAQSRLFEELLVRNRMPYQIYGGMRFFERAEVKDMIAYLRLIITPQDNASFLRIINQPPRGIGLKSIERITRAASEKNIPYWESAKQQDNRTVIAFIQTLEQWKKSIMGLSVQEQLDFIFQHSHLIEHYEKESQEKASIRKQNIEELIVASGDYEDAEALLSHIALESGELQNNQNTNPKNCVQLMTIHSSKGLEFPLVFMVGMEEGLFPSNRSILQEDKLAEERRLAYVGMTRAREKLYLSFASYRQLYGKQFCSFPASRFLSDLPNEHTETLSF